MPLKKNHRPPLRKAWITLREVGFSIRDRNLQLTLSKDFLHYGTRQGKCGIVIDGPVKVGKSLVENLNPGVWVGWREEIGGGNPPKWRKHGQIKGTLILAVAQRPWTPGFRGQSVTGAKRRHND